MKIEPPKKLGELHNAQIVSSLDILRISINIRPGMLSVAGNNHTSQRKKQPGIAQPNLNSKTSLKSLV